MSFRLRQITTTAAGREIVRERVIDRATITIGRAAENDIHLPDLAVAPHHAKIETAGGRRLRAAATAGLEFDVDGRKTLTADIDSARGAELGFGGHRLTLTSDGGDTIITIARVDAVSDAAEEKDEERVFSLANMLPSRRASAWVLSILILLAFLAVPLWSFASYQAAQKVDTRNIYALKAEHSWTPGALSEAHHALETKCEACHRDAFVSVRDDSCKACHGDVHDHAPVDRIRGARAAPGWGGQVLASFASAFNYTKPGACVDCHTEHKGAGPMPPTRQAFCTDCHADLKSRLADTRIGNAGDFGTAHPQFRPAVMVSAGSAPPLERISLDAHPKQDSGLKFPHALHLSATNGVAQMARRLGGQYGFGAALTCKDCHSPTADGTRFQPVSMERNCQMCHSLAFERIGGTDRTLRHGDVNQVIADLTAYYRSTSPAAPIDLGGMARRRPGDFAGRSVAQTYAGAAAWRPASGDAAVRALFSRGGACYDCHTITPPGVNGAASWTVTPVHQQLRYMLNGWFDHAAHKTETCESCHAARQSTSAADVLLPDIKSCRACHGGEQSAAKVPSSCAMCHSYHQQPGAPWRSRRAIIWSQPVALTRPDKHEVLAP